ncbi:uncharacterized protein [Dermacentor andersoni]|uniref:uncharacterized protein n=1 Tax=Dermacentor andersoni TaxID=34620 RepID=UPI002417E5C5|nr:uncharacterized protein LOC129384792 [Dermacentor andersoni]
MEEKAADATNVLDAEASRSVDASRTQESSRGKRKRRRSKKAHKQPGDSAAAPGSLDKGTRGRDLREQSSVTPTEKSSSSKLETTEKTTNKEETKERNRDNSAPVKKLQGAVEGTQNPGTDRVAQAPSSVGNAEAPQTKAVESAPRGDVSQTPEENRQRCRYFNDVKKTVALTAGLITVIFIIIIGPNGRKPGGYVTCDTDSCNLLAQRLRASLNASAAVPCYNFKEFVCNGWRRQNTYSVRQNMTLTALYALAGLANSVSVPTKGQTTAQKGAGFFRSCYAVLKNDKNGIAVVKKLLREAKVEWPRRPS